ncbi:MAG TPA: MFS transporter [Alphaproteobacteria bacterium]|nr:MFS transporter [Alphaproteobacteria bacterium]
MPGSELSAKPEAAPEIPPVVYSASYVRYAVGILSVVYLVNLTDRQILAILMQPIKQEMRLSDTELGFLGGIAFAIFYSVLGLPIARLADRYSRVNILVICLGLWSLMTAFCGLAQNFWQLLAARIGVGVGEAGGSPPSHSLIADYVPVESRSTALGIFAIGVPLGLLSGYLLGGWIEQLYGWRAAFLSIGLPGVILAAIVYFTLEEPPRGHSQGGVKEKASTPPIMEVVRHMWAVPSFLHLSLGTALQAFATYSIYQWIPSFLSRSYQMQSGEIGMWLALVIGVGGVIGTFSGGYLADLLSKRDMRWQMWLPAICIFLAAPFCVGIYLSDTASLSLIFLFFPMILVNIWLGPGFSVTQTLAPVRMRAMASALLLFVLNIIGLGMGPQAVGIMSDLLAPAQGQESLRYALLISSSFYIWSAYHFWRAARTLRIDLKQAVE